MREKRPDASDLPPTPCDSNPTSADAQRMLATLIGNLPGLVYRCRNDEHWTAEFFSEGSVTLTGYPAADFIERRRHYADVIHPDDRIRVRSEIAAALALRHRFAVSYRIVTAADELRWVYEQGCGVFAPDGTLQAIEGFISDVTAQRAADTAIHESERRYRSLFAANPHPMWVYDIETLRFLAVNDIAVVHYGFTREEFMRMRISDIRPPEDIPLMQASVRANATTVAEGERWHHRCKDDSIIEVEITSHPLEFDGRRAKLVLANDVTERRRTEAAIRLQAAALNAADNAIMIADRNGTIEWVNAAWTTLTGYSAAEAIGQTPRLLKSGVQDHAYYERFWQTILAGKSMDGEIVNRRKDGTLYHESQTITPVLDPAGCVTHFVAIKQDITARKRAEADREREASLLASTLRSLPGIFYHYDGDGRLLRWNDNFPTTTGYPEQELRGRSPFDFIAPEDRARVREGIDEVFAKGASTVEAQLFARDGTRTPYHFTGVRVEIEGKLHLVGVGVDLTERRQAEEHIRRLNRTYAVLSDINQLIVRAKESRAVLDESCRIAVAQGGFLLAWIGLLDDSVGSLRLAAHCGADQATQGLIEQFLQQPQIGCASTAQAVATGAAACCNDIEHEPSAAPWREAALQRGYRAMASFPFSIADGRTGTFNLYAPHAGFFDADEVRLLTELAGDIGFGLKILEHERQRAGAESALRESEARFRTVLETVALIGLMLDREGRVLLCSDYLLELTGWTRAEVVGGDWFQKFLPPGDREQVRRELFLAAIGGGTIPRQVENEILTRQGERRMIAWSNSLMRDSGGAIVGVTSLGEDITERRRAELQVRKLAAFPKFNPNPVLEFSAEGKLTYANPAAQALAGAIGTEGVIPLLPADSSPVVRECLATGRPRLRLLTHHGRHTVSWSFHPIAAEGIVHCYADDITERLALEEQLRQSQKMDAIGQLAGGIAHDFNNLLTVIQGNASMLQTAGFPEADRAEALGQIDGAAGRAATLTRQLLAFSRRQMMQPRPLDLNEAVTSVARMLQRVLGEHVHLQLNLHTQRLVTLADPGMLDQVLMNLAVNARDAMPEGGQLVLSTSPATIERTDRLAFPDARSGPHVCLRVADTGRGIPVENLSRIFEPFFTTKAPGKGTGLGLATVFGIVRQHEGILRVSSELGRGTAFEILLPASATPAPPDLPPISPALPRGAGETVLVVEDEAAVRRLAVRVLGTHGYRVLEAADGPEALRLCAASHQPIDLLLTDMIMPGGLSGLELAQRMRSEIADLKILYMSGYPGEATRLGRELREGENFLPKPFTPVTLLECVRARLRSSSASNRTPI